MIKPLSNYIILKTLKNQTASGIILHDIESYAVIVAINDDEKDLKVNDTVIYKNLTATEINFKNQKYLLVEKKDIMAVISDE